MSQFDDRNHNQQRRDARDRENEQFQAMHRKLDADPPIDISADLEDDKLEQVDQRIRINELRELARDAGGGEMDDWTAADCPLDLQEAFWESVLAWETAPDSTYLELLAELGVPTPPPERMGDSELQDALWSVIRALSELNVFLSHTDHLSDRDLYGLLWSEILRQPTKHVPASELWHCELDLLGGCSREDLITLQTYYPDHWCLGDWDEAYLGPKPESKTPEFDRDRLLPKESENST